MKSRLSPQPRHALLALLLLGTGVSAGQNRPDAPPPPPTFKSETNVVVVDAVVTDKQGHFVRGLTKDDFTILQDGKPQPISAFALVDLANQPPDRAPSSRPVEPDVRTNERPFEGRVYLLVLDDINTDGVRSPYVKTAARRFIEQHFHDDDLMAVMYTGRSNVGQSFTNNRRLLLAVVDQFFGRKDQMAQTMIRESRSSARGGGPGSPMDDVDRQLDAASTLQSIRGFAEWMGGTMPGRRKALILLSEGLAGFTYDDDSSIFGNNARSRIADEMREAVAAAAQANVSIFTIDPRGGGALLDEEDTELRTGADSLRALAHETGGVALVHSNNFAMAFDRVVADASSYYVLAYMPPADKRAGTFHTIDVKVNRQGVDVRARKGYASPKKTAVAQPAAGTMPAELRTALNSSVPISGLTLTVFATAFKGDGRNASVLVGTELRGRDLGLTRTDASGRLPDQVELTYVAADRKGIKASRTAHIRLSLKPETATLVGDSALRTFQRLDLQPGTYQLRVAAHDGNSRHIGSVLYDLEVPDFIDRKTPLAMSGLVLTSALSNPALVAAYDDRLKAVMPRAPTALRTFTQNDEIAVFAEIYDSDLKGSHIVDILTTVLAGDGQVVFKSEDGRSSDERQTKSDAYSHLVRIALQDFPPGGYVLRVQARSRVGDSAVSRDVPFTIAPR